MQGIVGMSIYIFFAVNYRMSCSFSLSKTVNLMGVFYCNITLNGPLFTVYRKETFC